MYKMYKIHRKKVKETSELDALTKYSKSYGLGFRRAYIVNVKYYFFDEYNLKLQK